MTGVQTCALPIFPGAGAGAGAGAAWAARGPLPVLRASALREAVIITRRHLGSSTARPLTRRRERAGPPARDVIRPAPRPRAARAPPRAPGPAPRAKLAPSRFLVCAWGRVFASSPPRHKPRPLLGAPTFPLSAQYPGSLARPPPSRRAPDPALSVSVQAPPLAASPAPYRIPLLPFNLSAWGFRGWK